MTLDPNLDLQLATEYVGGITLPVPAQIGHYARVDPTGINLEYVPLDTPTILKDASIANGFFVAGTRAAPKRYKLRGTIVVPEGIVIPSFVDIDAETATIVTTLAPAVGFADDWTNALFKAASVSTATTTTVVADGASTAAYPGATRIAVASSAGFVAGDWIRVYSYNAASRPNPYFTGEYLPNYRIYKVASVASGILNIVGVIRYWHANYVSAFDGSTVTKITLTEGINWRGGRFDCSGGSIANAFSFDGVLNGSVNGATFKGFSRACVELLRGSQNFVVNDFSHEGEINAGIYIQQSEQVQIDNFKSPAYAAATKHANGIPRALITLRRRASHIQISNAHFGWGTIGLQLWGVDSVNAVNINVENMNGNNRPASIDGQLSTRCGIAIDGGQASITTSYLNGVDGIGAQDGAPFSFNVNIENVVVSECLGDSASQCYVYFHDTISQKITNLSIAHLGNGDGTGGPAIKPIIGSDAPGSYLKNVHTNGTYGCIYTENGGFNHGTIDGVYHQAACGVGYSNGPLFGFNHGGGGGQLTIRNVKISNGGRHWEFDTQFTDWNMQVENFQADAWTQPSDLLICVVNAGARPADEGRIMQLTGALGGASSKFPIVGVAATGAVTKCVATATGGGTIFENGTNGGYGFVQVVQPGKRSSVQCANTVGTGPAITQGDFVRHSAAGDGGLTFARGDNAVTFDKVIGKVCGAIPSVGATGLVKLI